MRLRLPSSFIALVVITAATGGACYEQHLLDSEAPPPGDPRSTMDGGADGHRPRPGDGGTGAADARGRDGSTGSACPGDGGSSPEWVPLEGVTPASGCTIERSTRCDRRFGRWVPCEGGVEGCEQLEPAGRRQWEYGDESAHHDGEHGWFFAWAHVDPRGAEPFFEGTVVRSDLRVRYAWRSREIHRCRFLGYGGLGEGHVALSGASPATARTRQVWFEPLDTDLREMRPRWTVTAPFHLWSRPAVTSEMLVYGELTDTLMLVDTSTGSTRVLRELYGSPQVVKAVGDHVLWEARGTDKIRLAHATLTGESEVFYEIEGNVDVSGFATDGEDMVWFQGYGPPPARPAYDRVVIWTSPYVRDPDDLAPRPVTGHHHGMVRTIVDSGRAAFMSPVDEDDGPGERPGKIVVVDLSDGRKRAAHAPDGWSRPAPMWLTDRRLVFRAVRSEDATREGVFRVPLSSLPPAP